MKKQLIFALGLFLGLTAQAQMKTESSTARMPLQINAQSATNPSDSVKLITANATGSVLALAQVNPLMVAKRPMFYPKAIVGSGGGKNVGYSVGSVIAASEYVSWDSVRVASATSAGCIWVLAKAVGFTDAELRELWLSIEFEKVRGEMALSASPMCIFDGQGIIKLIERILEQKGYPKDITMGELSKKIGIDLYFFATLKDGKNTRQIVYGDNLDVPVSTAIRISCSVENYLKPLYSTDSLGMNITSEKTDYMLLDGNVHENGVNNLPIAYAAKKVGAENVLGFYTYNKDKMKHGGPMGWVAFNLGDDTDQTTRNQLLKNGLGARVIDTYTDWPPTLTKMTYAEMLQMLENGIKDGRAYFEKIFQIVVLQR